MCFAVQVTITLIPNCIFHSSSAGRYCYYYLRVRRMSKVLKASTGLTGLAVATNPHHTLSALYGKILRAVQKMPKEASYRKYTEEIVNHRLKAVEANKDVTQLEKTINCGQVEELITQAENELNLARKILGWKPWEPLTKPAPARQWDWPPAQISEPKI